MIISFDQDQIEKVEDVLQENLIESGVNTASVVDMAGHIIASCNKGNSNIDVFPLAALAAGNFNAVDAMAKIVGEDEFSLLFHKGENENLHFSKINEELLLITTFDTDVPLGFLRLKISESINTIKSIWQ